MKTLGGTADFVDLEDYLYALKEGAKVAFPNVVKGISTLKTAFSGAGGGLKGAASAAGTGISGLWKVIKAHPLAATTTAITGVVSVISILKDRAEKQRESLINDAEESKNNLDTINQVYKQYQEADIAYKNGAGSKEDLTAATDELVKALGYEGATLEGLIEKYGSLDKLLENVSNKNRGAQIGALGAYATNLQNSLIPNFFEVLFGGFGNAKKGNLRMGANNKSIQDKIDGILSNLNVGTTNGLFTRYANLSDGLDLNNIDDVRTYYQRLKDIETSLVEGIGKDGYNTNELSNSMFYKNLQTRLKDMEDSYENYFAQIRQINNDTAQELIPDYIKNNPIPKATDGLENYRKTLIEAIKGNESFVGSEKDIGEAVDNVLSGMEEFDAYFSKEAEKTKQEKISDIQSNILTENDLKKIEETYKSSPELAVMNGSERAKNFNDFKNQLKQEKENVNKFIESLTDDDLEIAYDVVVNYGAEGIESAKELENIVGSFKLVEDFKKSLNSDDLTKPIGNFLKIQKAAEAAGMSVKRFLFVYSIEAKANAKKIRDSFQSMWDSDSFSDAKNNLQGIMREVGRLDDADILNLAESSSELSYLLEDCGLSARFAAEVMEKELNPNTAGEGIASITEETLLLDNAIQGLGTRFTEVSDALKKYNEMVNNPEPYEEYKSFADAFDKLDEEFGKNFTGTNQFWASAELIFGENQLDKWGWYDGVEKILSTMQELKNVFADPEDAGMGFVKRLDEIADKNGKITSSTGEVLATVEKLSGGRYDVDIDNSKVDELAKKMGLSEEATLACIKALGSFGGFNYYDIDEITDSIEKLGLAANDIDGKTVVNISAFKNQLETIGMNKAQIHEVIEDLKEGGNIRFLDLNDDIETLIKNLEGLEGVTKTKKGIKINVLDFAETLSQMDYTKDQFETLLTNLNKSSKIELKMTGIDGAEQDIKNVKDAVATADKRVGTWGNNGKNAGNSIKTAVEGATRQVQTLNDLLKNGFTISISTKTDSLFGKVLNFVTGGHSVDVKVNTTETITTKRISDSQTASRQASAREAYANRKATGTKNAKDETVFVGEEGAELWQTKDGVQLVGVDRPEFIHTNKGDVIYPNDETKKILAGSKINGFKRRFAGGTTGGTGKTVYKENKKEDTNKITKETATKKNTSNSSSKAAKDAKDTQKATEKTLETLDFIETKLDRLEYKVSKLETAANNTSITYSKRLKYVEKQIEAITNEIKYQTEAYNYYLNKADSINLSDSLKKAAKSGKITIKNYSSETADLIKKYQDFYKKAMDCSKAVQELNISLTELYTSNFTMVQEEYENKLSQIEFLTSTYENGLEELSVRGYAESVKYYEALIKSEKSNISMLNSELSKLNSRMTEAMNNGVKEGSEDWYEMQDAINGVKAEIQEANISLIEYGNSLRQIKWDSFDYLQEEISDITDESEFLIDLLSNSDLVDENGNLTSEGKSVVGLRGQNYNVYMAQAEKYAKEASEISAQLATDPYNTELLERRKELIKLQRESILNAYQERKAMTDVAKEGVEKQTEAMSKLISKYEDVLDAEKDLYEYQRNIANQTENLASLEKQISAYENDTSEEGRMKLQQLRASYKEAQDDLKDTEYDRYVSMTKELLSSLSEDYSTVLNEAVEDTDKEIENLIAMVNANSGDISRTISDTASSVGYTLSDSISTVWNSSLQTLDEYNNGVASQLTSVNDALDRISKNVSAMAGNSDEIASETIKNTSSTTKPATTTSKSTTTTTSSSKSSTTTPTTTTTPTKTISVGGKINAGSALIYDYKGDTSGERQYFKNDPIYTVLKDEGGWLQVRHRSASSGTTGWFKKSEVKAYKTGGLADYTGFAWVDGTKTKPEAFLNSDDTNNIRELINSLRQKSTNTLLANRGYVATASSTSSLDIASMVKDMLSQGAINQGNTFGDINVTIPIERVEDYNDFVTQLKNDPKFEGMIQSMTINRIAGGSSLSKNRYRWN